MEFRIKALENQANPLDSDIPSPCPENSLLECQACNGGIDLPAWLKGVDPEDIPIEQRDKIILRLKDEFPGKSKAVAQKRIDILNAAGVLINGKPWTRTKQFSDQLNLARRRQVQKK